jgi:hypothetical protein
VVILVTELRCYSFLLKSYKDDDVRLGHLKLREEEYKQEVPELYRTVISHGEREKDWRPACSTVRELERQYKDAFGEDLDAISRIERNEVSSGTG